MVEYVKTLLSSKGLFTPRTMTTTKGLGVVIIVLILREVHITNITTQGTKLFQNNSTFRVIFVQLMNVKNIDSESE